MRQSLLSPLFRFLSGRALGSTGCLSRCGVLVFLLALSAVAAQAQIVVNSTLDNVDPGDGFCTLREAIQGGGGTACPGSGPVHFNIPGTGPHVIRLTQTLGGNTSFEIDGSTQPGNESVCTLPIPDRPAYQVILDGGNTVNDAILVGGSGSVIRGLNIRNFTSDAIRGRGSNVNLQCNFIGTDETGTVDMGNGGHGVVFTGDFVVGIQIGGTSPGQGNLISGNDDTGIFFSGPDGSTVQGNYIGTDKSGILPLGNESGTHYRSGASNHLFGGTVAGAGNIVAFNNRTGIYLDSPSSLRNENNRYLGNSVFQNGGLGLDIDEFGFLANDSDDSDDGANKRMNFPELTAASFSDSNLSVTYRVTSSASNQTYPLRVEFFFADVDGQEGQTYLGFQNYTNANQIRTAVLPVPDFGTRVVATATDADGNTSEFSPSREISGLPVDLSITKTDGVTTAAPGGALTYTLEASNLGPGDDPSAVVADTMPAGLTCTYTSIARDGASGQDNGSGDINDTVNLRSGSSITYTVSCAIDLAASGTVSNTATITASLTDTDTGNNTATDTTTLVPLVDVSVTMTGAGGFVVSGDTLSFTITAQNAGPSTDPAAQIVNNPPTDLTCTWTSAAAGGAGGNSNGSGNLSEPLSLPPGGVVTYTMECLLDEFAEGTLINEVSVTSSFTDSDASNNTASRTLNAGTVQLAVEKTGPATAEPGETIQYSVSVIHSGTRGVSPIAILDPMPSELESCSFTAGFTGPHAAGFSSSGTGDIADNFVFMAGGGTRLTYTVTCTVAADAVGPIRNTATATWNGGTEPDTSDNTSTVETVVIRTVDLSITKTDGLSQVVAGEPLTYTLVAANAGPGDEATAVVSDTLPADLSCTWTSVAAGGATNNGSGSGDVNDTVSLPSGSTVTYSISCSVASDATGTLSNTATITGSETDSEGTNNSATDLTTVIQQADISITKTNGTTESVPGTSTTYTVVVSNAGPSDDPSVSVTDTLPSDLSCTWNSVAAGGSTGSAGSGSGNLSETVSLPAGSSVTYTLSCNIDASASGSLINTATATGSFDGNASNNSATDTDSLASSADISITKTNGVTESIPGTSTTYTLVALNA
ncbi:MAG: DUF11 domain-containing protein, partial [Deltaproteobacteria bacterium]|nr:DUF11 domain-containing protein [Deltaproteobacteria bacterium]